MALFKSRPRVRLMLPTLAASGGSYEGEVVLDAKRAVAINKLRVEILGSSYNYVVVTTSTGKTTTSHRDYLRKPELSLAVELLKAADLPEGQLPAGVTKRPFRFDLPANLSPSFDGNQCGSEYRVKVHVDIPWWPDRRAEFVMNVPARAETRDDSVPVVFSTHPEGPVPGELQMELSLDSSRVVAGGEVRGSASFGNLANVRAPVRLRLEFVEHTTLTRPRRTPTLRRVTHAFELPLEDLVDGTPTKFKLPVPPGVRTVRHALYNVEWSLRCIAVRRLASDVRVEIPLEAVELAKGIVARRDAPPLVGGERQLAVLRAVAERRGLTIDENGALHGSERGIVFVVAPVRLKKAGAGLRATLEYRRIGLGLAWSHTSWLRRAVARGAFDGRVRARDEAQSKDLLAALETALAGTSCETLDDTHLEVTVRGGGTLPSLEAFVDAVRRAAVLLAEAGESVPSPTGAEDRVDAFAAIAAKTGGRFVRPALAVEIDHADADVSIATLFDADAAIVGLRVEYRVRDELQCTGWSVRSTREGAEPPAAWHADARDAARAAVASGARIEVGPHGVVIEWPELPARDALEDVAERTVERARTIVRALSGRTDRYR